MKERKIYGIGVGVLLRPPTTIIIGSQSVIHPTGKQIPECDAKNKIIGNIITALLQR